METSTAPELGSADGGCPVSSLPGRTSSQSSAAEKKPAAEFDNFYTPSNQDFYSTSPYARLDPKENEIRLLRFARQGSRSAHNAHHAPIHPSPAWPAAGDSLSSSGSSSLDPSASLIACKVIDKRALLQVHGGYVALSYCAGSSQSTKRILVNGQFFNVFANLAHAIECALQCWASRNADNEQDLVLWADQICINQADQSERASQVSMMREIYRNSADVYVCLSTPDPQPSLFCDVIPRGSRRERGVRPSWMLWAAELTRPPGGREPTSSFTCIDYLGADRLWKTLLHRLDSEESVDTWVASLQRFLLAPWWKRAWVYQEFVVAPQVRFLYHSGSISWDELSPLHDFVCHGIQARLDSWLQDQVEKRKRKAQRPHGNGGKKTSIHARQLQQRRDERQQLLQERDRQQRAARLARPSRLGLAWDKVKSFVGPRTIERLTEKIDSLTAEIQRLESGPQELLLPRAQQPKPTESAEKTREQTIQHLRRRLQSLEEARCTALSVAKGRHARSPNLADLLRHARNCLSSDPRDRVYAFLGLAEGPYDIAPCYDAAHTVERVLVDTALAIIKHDRSLGVLTHVGSGGAALGLGVPTWVPDWTAPKDGAGFALREHVRQRRERERAAGPFRASGDAPAVCSPVRPDGAAGHKVHLRVKGALVGKLGDAAGGTPTEDNGASPLHTLRLRDDGLRAVVPRTAGYNDEVWVLQGASYPVVLRPQWQNEGCFGFLGEAAVLERLGPAHRYADVMFGRVMEDVRQGVKTLRDIHLV